MQIKIAKRAWHSAKMNNDWQKFSNYFCKHYPMDKTMAKYFREAMKSTDKAAWNWKNSFTKTATPKRKTIAKKRKTSAKRRTSMKRRTTAKRAPAKRFSTRRYSAPKRRSSYKRRAA